MKKLLLFDIDGTLLTGFGDNRFVRTVNEVHDLAITSDKDFRGYTDYLILYDLLASEGWGSKQIETAMPELLQQLDRMHQKTFRSDSMKLLPGVENLLEALSNTETTLGLITGNLKTIAERKLEALGIGPYFTVGGFGNDPHEKRSDLVSIAVKRAGFQTQMENVYVIGDTPRDILAAKEARVINSVGVANGFRSIKELTDVGAEIVFEDFTDTQEVLKKLGVGPSFNR